MCPAKRAYTAESLEVLTGLEPVRRRPGMYTNTNRPNHLAQEVIDNSVDEALAGYATRIHVTLHVDGSLSVEDNGRGMPVDIHPVEKVSGIELILTRLHAGAKFSDKDYNFSGGLHGVGISVVNALSDKLEVWVKRSTGAYHIAFARGEKTSELVRTGSTSARDTGTLVRFWPEARYFDVPTFAEAPLKQLLRAKAVLCPGLTVIYTVEATKVTEQWHYADGLSGYLSDQLSGTTFLPDPPFTAQVENTDEQATFAVVWATESAELVQESYVNLIPTAQGGTHVNGLRSGLCDAMRDFCEMRNLLPRGVKLAPEDVWEQCRYVLSVKLRDPQFAGQTKERLSSRECAAFMHGVAKDAFSLWLNQQVTVGLEIAQLVIDAATRRLRASQKVTRKKITSGPALPGKLSDCTETDLKRTELFLVEGDSAGGSAKQARDRRFQAVLPLRGKILNTWEVDGDQLLASQEIHDITVALGVDPGSTDLTGLRYGKLCILADADSDGLHIATLLCALFLQHFPSLVEKGHICVAMPPLFRIDAGKQVFYALDESEKTSIIDRIRSKDRTVKINVLRFKGLGEMNPIQLRETTMAPDTRRLVQLTLDDGGDAARMLDKLLAKKRAMDRREWLEEKGNLAETE